MKTLKIKQQITSRIDESVDKYLKDISKIDLLTTDEEVDLAIRIRSGDIKALESLVNSNLRFVISVAKQYQNQGLSLSDLISEGNIGLIKAANRFDATKGFKFISYAVWWIRQTILQALAENSRIVRLPVNKVGAANKVNKIFVKLMQEYEREPTAHEIAIALCMKTKQVKELLAAIQRPAYLEAPVSTSDDKLKLIDLISLDFINDDEKCNEAIKSQISILLKSLGEREFTIVKMYYGIDYPYKYTLDEIAKNFGLTRERIRQLKTKAMRKLKKNANRSV
jgi:RNA polymerase primary sigma factor